jgi:hypothetical protein
MQAWFRQQPPSRHVGQQIHGHIRQQVHRDIGRQVGRQIRGQVLVQVGRDLGAHVGRGVERRVQKVRAVGGIAAAAAISPGAAAAAIFAECTPCMARRHGPVAPPARSADPWPGGGIW